MVVNVYVFAFWRAFPEIWYIDGWDSISDKRVQFDKLGAFLQLEDMCYKAPNLGIFLKGNEYLSNISNEH